MMLCSRPAPARPGAGRRNRVTALVAGRRAARTRAARAERRVGKGLRRMKLYMHWDMEGVSGLFTREQVWFWEEGVRPEIADEGRRLLMADVNSATAAALKAGADRVIVCDTHHGGGNMIIPEMLDDPRVTYHGRSRAVRDGKSRWMPDLDERVDGLMLMGHHAKAGTAGAFL